MGLAITNPIDNDDIKVLQKEVQIISNKPRLILYASPTGTGDGLSSSNPTTLENIRLNYLNGYSNVNMDIYLTPGEHVVNHSINIKDSNIKIYGDATNWSTNPTIITSQATISSKIAEDYTNSFTCAAHTDPNHYTLFNINTGSYIGISDVICRNNSYICSEGNASCRFEVTGKWKFQLWTYDGIYSRFFSSSSNSSYIFNTDGIVESDNCGFYAYTSNNTTSSESVWVFVTYNSYIRFYNSGYIHCLMYNNSSHSLFAGLYRNSVCWMESCTLSFLGYDRIWYGDTNSVYLLTNIYIKQEYNPTTPIDGQCKFEYLIYLNSASISEYSHINLNSDIYTNHYFIVSVSSLWLLHIYGQGHTIYIDDTDGVYTDSYFAYMVHNSAGSLYIGDITIDYTPAETHGNIIRAYGLSKFELTQHDNIIVNIASDNHYVYKLEMMSQVMHKYNTYTFTVNVPNTYTYAAIYQNSELTKYDEFGNTTIYS